VHGDVAEQVLGISGLADDVEAGVLEQPRDSLAQEHGVLRQHDAHRRRARTRPQRGEVAAEAGLVQLEDALRFGEVGQGPEAEVAELAPRRQRGRAGLGGDDLAAVAGGGDPVGAMDVDADVAVVAERGRAGVQADPGAHGGGPVVAAEAALRVGRRRGRRVRCREDGEELVAAGVDLVSLGAGDRLPKEAADVGQHVLPLVAQVPRQPGRSLDVGEEERDGAGRELAHTQSLGGDAHELRAPLGRVGEGVVEGVEGASRVDGELEARLAREMEHLDRDAVVVARPPESDVDAVCLAVCELELGTDEHGVPPWCVVG
jgi:hypothetical protein